MPTLADVVPSLLAGLDVPGTTNHLNLPAARRACLLLVDGLGWELLRTHADDAPFLSSLEGGPVTAGFPATTAASLGTIGTGVPSGEHGLVGYTFAVSDDVLLDALRWNHHGTDLDLRGLFVPEELQPRRTAFEIAEQAGVAVHVVTGHEFAGSGLTRAALRGGRFDGVFALGDLAHRTLDALGEDRSFCYAYHADLDKLGHLYGPGSEPWRMQLGFVDRLARTIAERMPPDALLVVTADHGMVTVDDRIDFDAHSTLQNGVRLLGGEARYRHVYTDVPDDVLATWRGVLGDKADLASRDEAIALGWFGPVVADHVRHRIGDIVVAMRGTHGIVRSVAERRVSRFVGHHGSFSSAEQLVPILTFSQH
ncbi:phosphodiesterase [Lentzea sp. NBRC 105346]|uniref:alkaline phosphatase family protein n=1 Tax=Lentzea sp. NBRC 105346 TaxID=3032205 RepID=UPI0024A2B22A|nr:alkaline phosphatase family protein [Lentzea sp. NBRC 105346]GLZ28477.1 phosphodiesterase [Lentzea sp. NBRC 105346]